VRKGKDRSFNSEHLCDLGPHQVFPFRMTLFRFAAGGCLTVF
jgi:hypothetical protein